MPSGVLSGSLPLPIHPAWWSVLGINARLSARLVAYDCVDALVIASPAFSSAIFAFGMPAAFGDAGEGHVVSALNCGYPPTLRFGNLGRAAAQDHEWFE